MVTCQLKMMCAMRVGLNRVDVTWLISWNKPNCCACRIEQHFVNTQNQRKKGGEAWPADGADCRCWLAILIVRASGRWRTHHELEDYAAVL